MFRRPCHICKIINYIIVKFSAPVIPAQAGIHLSGFCF